MKTNKLDEILSHLQALSVARAMEVYENPESKFFEMDMAKLIKEAKQAIIELIEEEIIGELDYKEEKYRFCSKCACETEYTYCPDCGRKSVEKIRNELEYSNKNCILRDFAQKLQKLKE